LFKQTFHIKERLIFISNNKLRWGKKWDMGRVQKRVCVCVQNRKERRKEGGGQREGEKETVRVGRQITT
jgi:hypothetical protein